jgi:hypothetical protein
MAQRACPCIGAHCTKTGHFASECAPSSLSCEGLGKIAGQVVTTNPPSSESLHPVCAGLIKLGEE